MIYSLVLTVADSLTDLRYNLMDRKCGCQRRVAAKCLQTVMTGRGEVSVTVGEDGARVGEGTVRVGEDTLRIGRDL